MTWPRRRRSRTLIVVLALLPVCLFAQQRDARAPSTGPVGTAEISGIVVSADSPAQPLRRVVVTLTGGALNPRSVVTDDAGRFTFGRLPAGAFTVTARKAAYLAAQYGARRPGRAGMPIALGNGQKTAISIVMFRGAAITGVLRDASGEPVRGVGIRLVDARTLSMVTSDASSGDLATTDDRGVFRLYGLLPGDYFVAALPVPNIAGAIVASTTASNDAALGALAARRPGGAGSVAATAPTVAPAPVGFAPIFFPGTANPDAAVSVRIETGEERAGVDFPLALLPTAAIEGTVRGDIQNIAAARITVFPLGPRVSTTMTTNSLTGHGIDAQGQYRYGNLTPGRYRIVARASRADGLPASNAQSVGADTGRGTGAPSPPADYLYGFADVELNGQDVTNVDISLQPGGTIGGRILFAGADGMQRPVDMSKVRVGLSLENGSGQVSSGGLSMGSSLVTSSAVVNADGTFEIRAIGPGRFKFTAEPPAVAEGTPWKLRSVVAGDRDLLDDATELGPGIDLRNVIVTFSDARTEISGTLQGAAGELVTEFYIVALPADRALWRAKSRRILYVRPGTDGRFVFADPPAGEYVLAAVTDLDPIDLTIPSFLEPLAAAGVKVTLAEGEKKVQNLQVK